jgi:Tol biopolymer transport system component
LDDPDTVFPTIWVMDLLREGAVFRFTDTGLAKPEFTDAWSPDSRKILFSRGDDRGMRLLRQALNGGTARTVIDTEGPKFPSDWSSDGQVIAYGSQWPDYRYMHIWIVALSASEHQPTARPFLQHSHGEFSAHFSPANEGEPPHWLAYMSNETGRYEVYVRDFPTGNYKWQISNQGGLHPQWRSDGRELFYVTLDGTLGFSRPVFSSCRSTRFGWTSMLYHATANDFSSTAVWRKPPRARSPRSFPGSTP